MHRANSFVYCMFLSLLLLLVCMVFCCCSVYKYCLVLYVVTRFVRFWVLEIVRFSCFSYYSSAAL